MRWIGRLIGIVFLAFAVGFSRANVADVALNFWPFDVEVRLPLYAVVLGVLALGVCLGGVLTWIGSLGVRFQARRLRKELAASQAQNDKVVILPPKSVSQNWMRRFHG